MKQLQTIWKVLTLFSLVMVANQTLANKEAEAEGEAAGPHQRIEQTTEQLIVEITNAKAYFDEDPERFYAVVDGLLSPVVDFKTFTRSVMGPFGQRDYYVSLSKEEREQFKQDYKRFVQTFKQGLIASYAKGLFVFDGQEITVLSATQEDSAAIKAGKPVTVKQAIKATQDEYVVQYRMAKSKKGDWVVRNVVIESINVGQLYQNQFVASMKKHGNNFSLVIDQWVNDTKDTQFAKKKEADQS